MRMLNVKADIRTRSNGGLGRNDVSIESIRW